MTMHPRDLTIMPPETAALGQTLFPETNRYRILGDKLADVLTDEQFAEMYEPIGREAISPSVLALVTLFQFQDDVPDRLAAEWVVSRLDWKYALHLPLDDPGFDFSCLSYFRRRALEHAKTGLFLDAILDRARALGFLTKRGKQRTDSIAVLGAVRQLSTLELVGETLRVVVRALAQTDPSWVREELPSSFCSTYAQAPRDYRLTPDARLAALLEVGQDGFWLLERIDATGSALVRALAEVATMRTVWAQQYRKRPTGSATPVELRDPPVPSREEIITPHDPLVRAGKKRDTSWRGEKVHLTETAEDDGPRFLTDVTTANAASQDVEALATIRAHLAQRDLTPREQNVDAGYVSGKELADSATAGIALLGPARADTSRNGFKIDDFVLDETAKTATCPAGQTTDRWGTHTQRDGSHATVIRFAAGVCAPCPLRSQCVVGKGGRSLWIGEHRDLLEARRQEMDDPAFRTKLTRRAGIEATLSELTRKHGFRRHRYRGEAKRIAENVFKVASCNLKRLIWALGGRPPTEQMGTDAACPATSLGPLRHPPDDIASWHRLACFS